MTHVATLSRPAAGIFAWRDAYEVGEPTVDAQHHQLLELAALLHEAALRRRLPAVIAEALHALQDYAAVHFDDEEDLFARIGSPLAAEHKAQHDELRAEIAALSDRLAADPDALPGILVTWVEHRLVPHMIDDDQAALAAAHALWAGTTG